MARRRFELIDGDLKRFWEAGVDGAVLTTVTGAIGSEGRPRAKTHRSPAAAKAALGAAIHQMVGLGYQEVLESAAPVDDEPVLAELIAAVHRTRPVRTGDPDVACLEAQQVLADWLVDHGSDDPLIALFAAAVGRRAQGEDWREDASLVALQQQIEQSQFAWPGMSVTWGLGRLTEIRVDVATFHAADAEQGRAVLHAFLASPLGRILEGLSFTGSLAALDPLLGGPRPDLVQLTLRDVLAPIRTVAPLLPGLRVLTLLGGAPALGALGLPQLEVLRLETDRLDGDQLQGLKYIRLPNLRVLSLQASEGGPLPRSMVLEVEAWLARSPALEEVVLEGIGVEGLFAGWWRSRVSAPNKVVVRGAELSDDDVDALLSMAERGTQVCIAPSRYLPGPDPSARARLKAHPRVTLEAPVTAAGEIVEVSGDSDDPYFEGTME